jgi:hypothetical protein
MKTKPTLNNFSNFLYTAGFRWHSTGKLTSKDKSKYGEFFKGDSITDDLKAAISAKFGKWVKFYVAQSEYAPECKRPMIVLLSEKAFACENL